MNGPRETEPAKMLDRIRPGIFAGLMGPRAFEHHAMNRKRCVIGN